MSKTLAEQLKKISFLNSKTGSKVNEVFRLATEEAQKGNTFVTVDINRCDFSEDELRQVILAVEKEGFQPRSFNKTELGWNWSIKWA